MKGKSIFTRMEADAIVALIRQKIRASTEEQKKIRNRIRILGFYASDFGIGGGYTEHDFLRVVKVVPDGAKASTVIESTETAILPYKLNEAIKPDYVESLAPIADQNSRVLILGTMPGVESLKQQFYYSHSRNLFWQLVAAACHAIVPQSKDERKGFLLDKKIAVWDVCKACIRKGSLDENISEETPNDILAFLKKHPEIRLVAFNGKKAAGLFEKHFKAAVNSVVLPSSSPANASISVVDKKRQWMTLSNYLTD